MSRSKLVRSSVVALIACCVCITLTRSLAWGQGETETVRIATWNVEHMNKFFDQTRLPYRSQDRQEVFDDEEDLLEVAMTIKLAHFDPDVLVLQEAADQASLEQFNRKWLDGKYAYVKVFKSNSPGQWTAIMVKPGFKVLETRELADTKDPVNDPQLGSAKRYYGRDSLFPRGPGFAKIQTPGGKVMWIGTTHIKSKGGNNTPVTRWRVRMIEHLRDAALKMTEDTEFVAVLGDFNDTYGMDQYEQEIGTDAIAQMIAAQAGDRLTCPTHALATDGKTPATYHCKLKPFDPTFIDHIFVSPLMQRAITNVQVIDDPIAHVASDHLPVMMTVTTK